jgi:hypothetical protein
LGKIVYSKKSIRFLSKLIKILFEKDYFSFEESAIIYTEKVMIESENLILKGIHKNTPFQISKYGRFYSYFNSNSKTTWYFFFDIIDNTFIIRYISNNHVKEIANINS